MKKKKLIIFDFDGTLVDSMETFANIAAGVMEQIFGTPFDKARKLYIETSGLPFFQQLDQIYPGRKENAAAAKQFEEKKVIDYFDQQPYPDAAQTIEALKARGYITAVSSNNFQNLVDEFTKRSGLTLDHVLGFKTESFCKGKPHFEHLIKKTGVSKDKMVFVGDSLKDAERAIDFRIDFIGKTGLFTKKDFTEKYPILSTIDQLGDLTRGT